MQEDLEERFGLDSLDPEIAAMLTEGAGAVGAQEAVSEQETARCLFDVEPGNGSADSYEEFSQVLRDSGYTDVSVMREMNMVTAELDREGVEIALRQPYVTSARIDRRYTTGPL